MLGKMGLDQSAEAVLKAGKAALMRVKGDHILSLIDAAHHPTQPTQGFQPVVRARVVNAEFMLLVQLQ